MLDAATISRIRDAVRTGFDEQVRRTAELVRVPSLMGQEEPAQDLVADAMRNAGLEVDRFPLTLESVQGRHGFSPPLVPYGTGTNVVGVHRPVRGSGRSLVLNGHVDVVPVGLRHRWSRDPFSGEVDGAWLHGRGAADMKAGVVACIAAFEAVLRAGLTPQAPVYVQSVIEEEATGNGTLACVERGYTADFAISAEASAGTCVTAQVGLLWFDVTVEGNPRHPSLAATGAVDAIDRALHLLGALRELENEWNAQKSEHPPFDALPRPVVIYAGQVEGGDWASSVPAWCKLRVRVGFYPGWERESVVERVTARIRDWASRDEFLSRFPPRVEPVGQYGEGYVLRGGDDALAVLAAQHREVTGNELARIASGGSSDARILGIDGRTPTVLYGPRGRDYHGYDEAVDLESVEQVTETLALFLADWCGVA